MEAAQRPTGGNMQGFLAGTVARVQVIAQFSIWFLATAPAGTVEFTEGMMGDLPRGQAGAQRSGYVPRYTDCEPGRTE